MKKLTVFLIAVIYSVTLFAQDTEVIRLSEPVEETHSYEVFGENTNHWEQPISLAKLIENQDEYIDREITLKTEVAEVCQKKGCFFIARDGDYTVRITFKDYEFFVPTDSEGKMVTLKGYFMVKELSEEQAKHYAEDSGEDPGQFEGPQKEYSVVAISVRVPRS